MVLKDHVRRRRRLVPPLLATMGQNYSPYSWATQLVPEFFWLAMLIHQFGMQDGVEAAQVLGKVASETSTKNPKPLFAKLSSFSELRPEEQEEVKQRLPPQVLSKIRTGLAPVSAIWPDFPLAFLDIQSAKASSAALDEISGILEALYDRRGREATLAVTTAAYLGLNQGRIILTAEMANKAEDALRDIEKYPSTDESRAAGAFFRAMAPMFLLGDDGESDQKLSAWAASFWDSISDLGGCLGKYQELPELPEVTEGIEGFITAYRHFANRDVRARQQAWKIDLGDVEEQQVLLALLARQATLAIEIVSAPSIWNPNTAPVLLRAMADVHITLVWLLGDPKSRVPMYVSDGLGAVKLEIAHREEEIKRNPGAATDEHNAYTEYLKNWLESQRLEFLVEVNLGSWSGKNTRVMAEESGCLDFYNYVFQPFSSAVHSYWSHVGRINVEYCQNPSHNFHFLPVLPSLEPDTHWCMLAAKYFRKTLSAFDEALQLGELPCESYLVVEDALAERAGPDDAEAFDEDSN